LPIYLIDKIKQKNGKTFKLLDAADVGTADGKSVEEKLEEIGDAGVFSGNTESTTPTEAAQAITQNKNVRISHADSNFGVLIFSNFAYAINAGLVVASVIFEFEGKMVNASLVGVIATNTWEFDAKPLEAEEKVATEVDFSGFETEGKIVETYSDGTSLTYNFEFNSEGNPTKITDSNGNETVFTW
jgi:hypothetical protein